jgi:peptidoglycan/LPS O-acetylase OafA/YrhL
MLTADWSNHAMLFVAYVYGFILAGAPGLGAAIDARWPRALAAAVVGSAGILAGAWVGALPAHLPPPYTVAYLAFWVLYALVAWAWMVALLGVARRSLDRPSRLVSHGGPRAYLWYVVHQPVVVAAAYFVVRWQVGIPVKVVTLAVLSAGGTVLASAALGRLPWISTLFGAVPTRSGVAAVPRSDAVPPSVADGVSGASTRGGPPSAPAAKLTSPW